MRLEDFTVLVIERMENADRITLGINKSILIDNKAPILLQESQDSLGVFELSYLGLHGGAISPAHDTWYRNARKSEHISEWRGALDGSAHQQNAVAGRLLFGNHDPDAESIELTDKTIDFDAAGFWLDRGATSGSPSAPENAAVLQRKRLSARFGGSNTISKNDFKLDIE